MSARRFWVRHAADTNGTLTLDAGAVQAIVVSRRSLLLAGVTAVAGDFHAGDVVQLLSQEGTIVARGVVAFDAAELVGATGLHSAELPAELRRPVVHADDLVPA